MSRTAITHALLAGALTLALCTAMRAAAQAPGPGAAADAAPAATPADQQKGRRERRRDAETVPQTAVPEADTPAQPAAAAPRTAQQAGAAEAEQICKNIKIVGTKIARRVCGTPEQWAASDERTSNSAQEAMRRVRESTGTQAGPSAGSLGPP